MFQLMGLLQPAGYFTFVATHLMLQWYSVTVVIFKYSETKNVTFSFAHNGIECLSV